MNDSRIFGPGAQVEPQIPLASAIVCGPRSALPVFQGRPRHLEAHLARLAAGSEAMGEPATWIEPLAGSISFWVSSTLAGTDAALRLALHPGLQCLVARLEPLPAIPEPYRLVPLPHPLSERRSDPILKHKGLAGAWGGEVLRQARSRGAEDALLLWPDGTLAETAIASVAVAIGGELHLPGPQGRVASLFERLDLPAWAESQGLSIVTRRATLAELGDGQLWCMNALRGPWPATLL